MLVDDLILAVIILGAFSVLLLCVGCVLMFRRSRKTKPGLVLNSNVNQNLAEAQQAPAKEARRPPDPGRQQFPILHQSVEHARQPQPISRFTAEKQIPLQNCNPASQCSPIKVEHHLPNGSLVEFVNSMSSSVGGDNFENTYEKMSYETMYEIMTGNNGTKHDQLSSPWWNGDTGGHIPQRPLPDAPLARYANEGTLF